MSKLADDAVGAHTVVVGAFDRHDDALAAVQRLQAEGMPADRIEIVSANVRQARESMGSYSPWGGVAGAAIGLALTLVYVVFGGDTVRSSPFAVVIGGFVLVVGLGFIGWLAGRARLFKQDEYAELEDDVALGETLVSVSCETPDGTDETRAVLERAGARDVRLEGAGESV
ncbi:MAG TPA: hypothetical protein VEU77_11925 [Candidatus Acidoferrales bacterium]|nr:hypothetical protein [Candidatus Acidoferrales bacterium]